MGRSGSFAYVFDGITSIIDGITSPGRLTRHPAGYNAAWLISNEVCSREELEKALKLGMGLKKELFATAEEFGIKNVVHTLKDLAAKHGQFYEPDPYLVSRA